jgi:predicted outer membrane protein
MRTFITVLLSSLAFALASAGSVRAEEKEAPNADKEFLTKVLPGTAASVKIIDYAMKNASDGEVRHFAKHVAKQHKEFVKTASEHAKRLKIAVVTDPEKDSKKTIDKLSKLKGADFDVGFLEWLIDGHKDTTVFDKEVKNGDDADLKTFAKDAITSGNKHLKKARALLAKVKK